MTMNCKRAKLLIALWVGDDLTPDAEADLNRHVAECSCCNAHFQQMRHSVERLQDPGLSDEYRIHDSLWPDLASRLPPRPGSRIADFNGWWVATAVTVACFAIFAFSIDQSRSARRLTPQFAAGDQTIAIPRFRLPEIRVHGEVYNPRNPGGEPDWGPGNKRTRISSEPSILPRIEQDPLPPAETPPEWRLDPSNPADSTTR